MIDKTRNLFLLFLCVAALGGANVSAQTGAEIGDMIRFYEWALEAKFSPAERAGFTALMEKDFADDARSAQDGTNEILATWTKIKRSSEEVRRRTRGEYLRSFLPKLKQVEREDASAKFLLDIFRQAHGGRDKFTDLDEARFNTADKGDMTEFSAVPTAAELAGKWYRTAGKGGITDGGETKYGSGERFTFEFFADGTIEYTVHRKTLSITQCRIESLDRTRGRVTIRGDSMTLDLGAGASSGTDSCDRSGNFRKTLPASRTTIKFRVKKMDSVLRPDKPTLLCFDGSGGEACFERETE